MAKVRVMAGDSINEDKTVRSEQDKKTLKKNAGALKLLLQVYKKKGMIGWYKVCFTYFLLIQLTVTRECTHKLSKLFFNKHFCLF